MPIKHRLERVRPESAHELAQLLAREWSDPKAEGLPLIILDRKSGQAVHVHVIWDKWGDLNLTERSELIMDVIESLKGEADVPDPIEVSVALGLTPVEARRMGIKFE